MTAHELARQLLAGPDLMVTRRGYEGGVSEVTEIMPPQLIHLDHNTAWYYGKHEYHDTDYCGTCVDILGDLPAASAIPTTKAIHLS